MCGIIAVVSKKLNGVTNDQRDIFDNLLFVDQLRGKDSTGMFMVTNGGELELAKEASNATVFREREEYKTLMNQAFRNGAALVGHNRAATKGSIIDANAHPFVVHDQITLVHNGTLWGDHKKLADTDVDSHAVAHQIHKHNGDVTAALKTLSGAYALIWHNFKDKTLNFIRNNHRPLHWVECADGWLWASEDNMLEWIAARYDIKPMGEIALLDEDTLVTYTQSLRGWDVESRKLDLAVPPPPAYKYSYQGPQSGYGGMGRYDTEYDATVYMPPSVKQIGYRKSGVADEIKDFEATLASQLGCHTENNSFTQEVQDIRHMGYTGMICADFHQINPTREDLGHHLYGTLVSNPNVLVKVYMDKSYTAETLMDLCTNERKCVTQVRNKQWMAYTSEIQRQVIGDGYVILLGDGCRLIDDVMIKDIECTV